MSKAKDPYVDVYTPPLPLTTGQAAAAIGVTASTLRQQIARGKLKATKVGRDHLIDAAEVGRYKAENIRSKYVKATD